MSVARPLVEDACVPAEPLPYLRLSPLLVGGLRLCWGLFVIADAHDQPKFFIDTSVLTCPCRLVVQGVERQVLDTDARPLIAVRARGGRHRVGRGGGGGGGPSGGR